MKISIVIPAFNEEKYLGKTLSSICSAAARVDAAEIIVVDNESTDGTAEVAGKFGVKLVTENVHNIGRVRNTGAATASGDVLLFIDADTVVPEEFIARVLQLVRDESCFGGSASVGYTRFERSWVRIYASMWKFWSKVFNMKGGAAQFCRRDVFDKLGGYDETIYLGEDVEFYWRLSKHARQNGGRLGFIEDLSVTTSSRRFDKMSLIKTVVLTHPFFIAAFHKKPGAWKDWYENAVR